MNQETPDVRDLAPSENRPGNRNHPISGIGTRSWPNTTHSRNSILSMSFVSMAIVAVMPVMAAIVVMVMVAIMVMVMVAIMVMVMVAIMVMAVVWGDIIVAMVLGRGFATDLERLCAVSNRLEVG
jgi:hypothetical protein